MREGLVVKSYSNFHYVNSGGKIYECQLRGKFRRMRTPVLCGDRVKFKATGEGRGVIEEILPRKVELKRPPVANVDQTVIVFSLIQPDLDLRLVDRLVVLSEGCGLEVLLCLNKIDLVDQAEVAQVVSWYQEVGYRVVSTSAKTGFGLTDLESELAGKVSVLAGQSGTGKSSLLNGLLPGLSLRTGEVSEKLGRGRHTTRHVQLLSLTGGGLVADTPGFSRLDLPDLTPVELTNLFVDLREHASRCRFSGCIHDREPSCAVKEAVEGGTLLEWRYRHYLDFLHELQEREENRYR